MSQPAPALTLPTVHMNGTGLRTLQETYEAAAHALDDFTDHWRQIEFNSRDYYPQGPEAWDAAVTQREAMNAKVRDLKQYLQTHREHFYDEEQRRNRNKP